MKRLILSAAVPTSTSVPVFANADQGLVSMNRSPCVEVITQHPDGTVDEERRCHTSADGTR